MQTSYVHLIYDLRIHLKIVWKLVQNLTVYGYDEIKFFITWNTMIINDVMRNKPGTKNIICFCND